MQSKKALFKFLDHHHHAVHCDNRTDPTYFQRNGLKAKGIGNETYGRKSCIYIQTPSKLMKELLMQHLYNNEFAVNFHYGSVGSTAVEVQVSYFKGFHWDE